MTEPAPDLLTPLRRPGDHSTVIVESVRTADELTRVRTNLAQTGFGAQRTYTHVHESGRPSVIVDDVFLQTEAFTSAFSWLLGRALGDSPPSQLNSIRTVIAARSTDDLDAAVRDESAWTTEDVEATPPWRLTRLFRLGDSGWELEPLSANETAVSGPFEAAGTSALIPAGHSGEHLLASLLATPGIDDPNAQGELRKWAAAARSVVVDLTASARPFDVLPRNFAVGDGGWRYVDTGHRLRFPYPPDVLVLRAMVWLLVQRVLPLGLPGANSTETVRDVADRLMRITGATASDVTVELWMQFEADLETRTKLNPRPWADILRELHRLLDRPASSLAVAVLVSTEVVAGESPEPAPPTPPRARRLALVHRLRWLVGNPLFDSEWYREKYEDVTDKNAKAYRHYRRHGWREGRDPNPFFDTDWYLARYPDVRSAGVNPLDHYLDFGAQEGRDPGPSFNGADYLERHPDVRAAGLNPLLHYLRHGDEEAPDAAPADLIAQLEGVLESAYEIRATRLDERRGGEGSIGYEVLDADEARWFVKVSPSEDPCWDVADRRLALLASHELAPKVESGTIVAPRLTSAGAPLVSVAGNEAAVFPYVESSKIGVAASWSDETMREVAGFVGEMHRASLQLRPDAVSTSWPVDYSRLEGLLDRLQTPGSDATSTQRRAAAIVAPHREELIGLAREFRSLRTKVHEMSLDLVLCHTDLNPANLLRDDRQRLVLIDCEDLTWAPAESDLYFLVDPRRVAVAIEAYREARGPCQLRPEPIELAYYADHLGLFYLVVCRVLAGRHSPAVGARYLADLQHYIVSYLDGRFGDLLSSSMDAIRAALADT